jgi:hypothetical protein
VRKAFDATTTNAHVLADARRPKLDIEPLSGEALGKVATRVVDISAAECAGTQTIAK